MENKHEIAYFTNSRGESPIKSFIIKQDIRIKTEFYKLVDLLYVYGPFLEPPFSKRLTHNLFELRGKGKLKIRIIYAYKNKKYVLLHIFNKKSQKTPPKEIETALKRLTAI